MRTAKGALKPTPKTKRRAANYWCTLNNWWRSAFQESGRRPKTAEVEKWFQINADLVWGAEKPSWKEARVHAKCLRSTEQVKNYFRRYRARGKQGSLQEDSNSKGDFTAGDGGHEVDTDDPEREHALQFSRNSLIGLGCSVIKNESNVDLRSLVDSHNAFIVDGSKSSPTSATCSGLGGSSDAVETTQKRPAGSSCVDPSCEATTATAFNILHPTTITTGNGFPCAWHQPKASNPKTDNRLLPRLTINPGFGESVRPLAVSLDLDAWERSSSFGPGSSSSKIVTSQGVTKSPFSCPSSNHEGILLQPTLLTDFSRASLPPPSSSSMSAVLRKSTSDNENTRRSTINLPMSNTTTPAAGSTMPPPDFEEEEDPLELTFGRSLPLHHLRSLIPPKCTTPSSFDMSGISNPPSTLIHYPRLKEGQSCPVENIVERNPLQQRYKSEHLENDSDNHDPGLCTLDTAALTDRSSPALPPCCSLNEHELAELWAIAQEDALGVDDPPSEYHYHHQLHQTRDTYTSLPGDLNLMSDVIGHHEAAHMLTTGRSDPGDFSCTGMSASSPAMSDGFHLHAASAHCSWGRGNRSLDISATQQLQLPTSATHPDTITPQGYGSHHRNPSLSSWADTLPYNAISSGIKSGRRLSMQMTRYPGQVTTGLIGGAFVSEGGLKNTSYPGLPITKREEPPDGSRQCSWAVLGADPVLAPSAWDCPAWGGKSFNDCDALVEGRMPGPGLEPALRQLRVASETRLPATAGYRPVMDKLQQQQQHGRSNLWHQQEAWSSQGYDYLDDDKSGLVHDRKNLASFCSLPPVPTQGDYDPLGLSSVMIKQEHSDHQRGGMEWEAVPGSSSGQEPLQESCSWIPGGLGP